MILSTLFPDKVTSSRPDAVLVAQHNSSRLAMKEGGFRGVAGGN